MTDEEIMFTSFRVVVLIEEVLLETPQGLLELAASLLVFDV